MIKMRLIYAGLILLVFAFNSCSTQNSDDISQWRGPNRDGVYHETNLLKEWPEGGPQKLWEFDQLGEGYSSVAIANNTIYSAGTIDSITYIFAFSMNGELQWKTKLGKEWITTYPGSRSTPNIDDGLGYYLSGIGGLYCFDAKDGKIVWEKDFDTDFGPRRIEHGLCENLLIDEDKLYVTPGRKEFNMLALNKKTGDIIWKSGGNGERSAYASPITFMHNNKKYISTNTFHAAMCLEAETGKLAWSHPYAELKYGIHANSHYYRDGKLFVSDGFQQGIKMLQISDDGQSVDTLWKNTLIDETNGHYVVFGDNIYGIAETKRRLVCVDWNTGENKYEMKRFAPGSLIATSDGMLYAYSYNGEMGLVQPTENGFEVKGSFKLEKRREVHIAHPVIHNGILYIRYMNQLMAYDISG